MYFKGDKLLCKVPFDNFIKDHWYVIEDGTIEYYPQIEYDTTIDFKYYINSQFLYEADIDYFFYSKEEQRKLKLERLNGNWR